MTSVFIIILLIQTWGQVRMGTGGIRQEWREGWRKSEGKDKWSCWTHAEECGIFKSDPREDTYQWGIQSLNRPSSITQQVYWQWDLDTNSIIRSSIYNFSSFKMCWGNVLELVGVAKWLVQLETTRGSQHLILPGWSGTRVYRWMNTMILMIPNDMILLYS